LQVSDAQDHVAFQSVLSLHRLQASDYSLHEPLAATASRASVAASESDVQRREHAITRICNPILALASFALLAAYATLQVMHYRSSANSSTRSEVIAPGADGSVIMPAFFVCALSLDAVIQPLLVAGGANYCGKVISTAKRAGL
jgi:hypothetical protein